MEDIPVSTRQLQSSKVPSSRIGRLFHYGGLAASLGYGAASEIIRRTASSGSEGSQQSVMMTEANITRLVSKLSQMRGAALKLGQFLSIQDTHVLPADVDKIFRRVQDSAHYMPDWQMEQVLTSSLGPEWATSFTSFDRVPFAAASIGQVHTAMLAASASPTGAAARVAVKIQFPNIASSIASDIGYISLLLTAGRLLPKGLFLERTMQVMKQELADECDYAREAGFLRAFGAPERLGGDERFKVPWVWDGSTDRVLVMEHVDGMSVGEAGVGRLEQSDRDDIAARIIELCLKELFEFRLMQTDPNWSNFLWNARTRRVELVDFGATREYDKAFIDDWLRLLQAAALDDRAACVECSLKLGYLTGEENQVMLDAHVNSMTLLATPFKRGTPQPFAFGQGTQWADITAQIRAEIPVMLQHRLTPPPRETYSLNRKLSGAFLLASRLGATVDTRAIWDKVVSKYEFGA
ncbi:ABC1-domain-containing protein [Mycena capillaripes]|nr:ABC1-domain-containing protein [Mycena capillaripes]